MLKKVKNIIKNTLSQIDDDAKIELGKWLESVQQIKNNSDLSKTEKRKQLSKLKPSDAVLTFLNSLLDLLILKIPIKNKKILKLGFSGAGLAASFLNFRKTGIILLILSKALPNFIMSRQFDDFSEFLTQQITKH